MSIIRERVELTNNNINITIPLIVNNKRTGQQQEIDRLTQFNSLDLVNPPVDVEKTRFKYVPQATTNETIQFRFHSNNIHQATFTPSQFTSGELSTMSPNINNSFFIMDFYDSMDMYSQNKIFTTYLTKINSTNLITRRRTSENQEINNDAITRYRRTENDEVIYDTTSLYDLSQTNHQWNKIAIPNWYVDQFNTYNVTGFTKFSFYNAKTGNLIPFINDRNRNLTTSERFYVRTILSIFNKRFRFESDVVVLNEMINNPQYLEKINNTVEKLETLRISPPTGNTFNEENRTYDTT